MFGFRTELTPHIAHQWRADAVGLREVLGAHKQLGAQSSLNGGARLGT